jgi:sec-independent protein translocase protein TatC
VTPPADEDTRLPAELEEELDRAVNPDLAAALKKSYTGLRQHASEDETPGVEEDAGADSGCNTPDTGADDTDGAAACLDNSGNTPDTPAGSRAEAGNADANNGNDGNINNGGNADANNGNNDNINNINNDDGSANANANNGNNDNNINNNDGNSNAGNKSGGNNNGDAADDNDDDNDEEEEDDDDDDDTGNDEKEEDDGNKPMTLRDHLVELRSRLFKSFLWLIAGFCLCWPWNEELFALLLAPLAAVMPEGVKFVYLSPPEAFFVYIKVCLAAGFFLTSPMVFYQVWAFIAPGLYKEEKLFILPAALSSAVFFLCGALFCRFVVFDAAFRFFMSYNRGPVQAMLGMEETFGFALQFLLAFGAIFELPLFIFFLSRLGLVTADMLRRFRRYAVLAAVIIGAVLTPPDVISQLLMAGPLILLYEIGIVIALLFGKKKREVDDAAEQDDDDDDTDPDTASTNADATEQHETAVADDAPDAATVNVADTASAGADATEQHETAVADTPNADAGTSAGARLRD